MKIDNLSDIAGNYDRIDKIFDEIETSEEINRVE